MTGGFVLCVAVEKVLDDVAKEGKSPTSTLSGMAPRTSVATLDVRLLDERGDEASDEGEPALDDESKLP